MNEETASLKNGTSELAGELAPEAVRGKGALVVNGNETAENCQGETEAERAHENGGAKADVWQKVRKNGKREQIVGETSEENTKRLVSWLPPLLDLCWGFSELFV